MENSHYGLDRDEFGIHQKIIGLVKGKKIVLEIGCASGYLSKRLAAKGCLITGVEINPEAAKKAKKFCQKLIGGDIEEKETLNKIGGNKAPASLWFGFAHHPELADGRSGYLFPSLRRERNPSEAENSSHSFPNLWFDYAHHPELVEGRSEFSAKGDKFEVIILADVLEHLKYPARTLKELKKFLSNKGSIIISVPNIAFLTSRLNLLRGRFDYEKWGIMDEAHLKFFTKSSVLKLVEESGLRVEKFDYVANFTQLPLYMQTLFPILGKRLWWRRLEYKIVGLWPEGLAVQFLLVCQKK